MGTLVSEIGEFGLIDRLRKMDVVRGIGDDCAVLTPPPGHDLVITADALIEGVHFRHDWISWFSLGHQAIAVNLSDLAAMGAIPGGLLVTLGLKPETTVEEVTEFYEGAALFVEEFDSPIVGGDIVAAPLATSVSVTAFGYVKSGRAIHRSGARPGDELWVTGTLGDSAAGLRLLQQDWTRYPLGTSLEYEGGPYWWLVQAHRWRFPNIEEAQGAVETGRVRAMMDISDGLAGDLGHLVRESGVGAVIWEDALPLSNTLRQAAAEYGWNTADLALHGGEDYELLMAVAPGSEQEFKKAIRNVSKTPVTRIGHIVEGSGITLRRADGTEEPLTAKAFTHF